MSPVNSFEYALKLIGGHNFSEKKCIFSLDGKLLLAITGTWIRIYIVSTGIPYGSLCINTDSNNSVNHGSTKRTTDKKTLYEEITNIQLDPYSPDTSVVSFTNTGRVTFWDYIKVDKTREYNIFAFLYSGYTQQLTLLYGSIVKHNDESELQNASLYYAVLADGRPFMYHSTIGHMERTVESDHRDATKKKLTKAAKEKIALERLKNDSIFIRFDPDRALTGITIGGRNSFLAAIENSFINIVRLPYHPNNGGIAHKIAKNIFTCITSHPKELLLAAGDSLGRVYIYREDFCHKSQPIRSVTHWHHSPVADLCFSPSGAYLYSGGSESVLVRLDVSFSHNNNFYPRLGSPIRYVVCDSMNEKILTCHTDNTFHCVSSNMDTNMPALDGLTLLPKEEFLRTPLNLIWDPKSESIVLKGKCGHLQFYSPFLEKQLYQLDIVNMNYIPPEVDKHIVNVDVDRFSVSGDGSWIATIEYREDGIMMPEMRLKFWKYLDCQEKKYRLNTCIHLPHKKQVNQLRFSRDSKFLITTSQDMEFKIWHLIKELSDKKSEDIKYYWICGRVGNLNRVLAPDKIATSSDFSVLAISFGCNTALWDSSEFNLTFKGTFLPPKSPNNQNVDQTIKSIEFGTGAKLHLLAETRSLSFRVWNLLTLSVHQIWAPPRGNQIKFSLFEQKSNRSAIFLTNGTIYIMDMDQECALIKLLNNQVNLTKITCGVFIPLSSSNDEILADSGLCVMDETQKIYSIGLTGNEKDNLKTDDDEEDMASGNMTPFAKMLMEEKRKMKLEEKLKQVELSEFLGPLVNRKKLVEDIFTNVPSHVLPPIETFVTSFLSSLLQTVVKTEKSGVDDDFDLANRVETSDEESDEDDKKNKNDILNATMDIDVDDQLSGNFVFNESYDWLNAL